MNDDDDEQEQPADRRQSAPTRVWSSVDSGLVGSNIPSYKKPPLDEARKDKLESLSSAYDFYRLVTKLQTFNNKH